jgi:hypothetical protein
VEISSQIELYDSEIAKIDKTVEVLARRQGTRTDLEGFRREIIDRFADMVGLKVTVNVYETNQRGMYWFEVQIVDRTDAHEFDHDRQVHEVTSNLLEIPGEEKGFIPSGDAENGHQHTDACKH